MPEAAAKPAIAELRARIAHLEGSGNRARKTLPFCIAAIDSRLPSGGLTLGSLHEVAGGGNGAVDSAAAAHFTAGIAARTRGKVLWCMGPAPASGQSWYVFYRFSRPTPAWKNLKRELDAVLLPFIAHLDPQPFEIQLKTGGEFWLKVFRAPGSRSTFFRHADHSDEQSGGWLIGEIETNLNLYIAEKTGKIAGVRANYSEWWLILPGQIGYGLDDFEQKLFLDQVSISPGGFDKIILLDPRDATRAFKVHP